MDCVQAKVVYVCSIIPNLSEALKNSLKECFPDVEVRDIPTGGQAENATMADRLLWRVGDEQREAVKDAEILIVEGRTLAQLACHLPAVKWVQLTVTGVDRLFRQMPHLPKPDLLITRNTSDSIAQLMAEYVLGQIISQERRWDLTKQNQMTKSYDRGDEFSLTRSLRQLTVGILGLGTMSLEVARSLKCFHCRVIGFCRNSSPKGEILNFLDKCLHTGQLPIFLSECDYVVNVLPSTSETINMLGNDVLKDAKRSPVFINVGRGDIIKTEDLLRALEKGWISTAILDVVEIEPLPSDSPLWVHPKVKITPHVAGFGSVNNRINSVVETFIVNYRKYAYNEPLTGVIDWEAGY